jgi:TonB-dependent SusC/RagA subfamily outer membrane receptor
MKQFRFKTLMSLFALVAILCATSLTAQAQTPAVSIDVKNVSVKELFKTIEAESGYTFAYVDSEIDLSKNVSVNAKNKSIISIISEVLPNMQVELKDKKVVLTARPAQPQKTTVAATRTVTGKVVEPSGDPVIGAMVILEGTTIGSATDLDGKYSITIQKNNAVLEVSSIGYKTTRVQLNDHQVVADLVLPTEVTKLDDVVVIGYGVQNKRDVTTAITSIKAEEFKSLPTADFRDAMAAKMPGVQVLSLGGQPDGNVSIRVRGIQSATSGNDPLYVIDGVPCDARAFANIDGTDIESLEVLKDASAAAIYGSRGSCGVILITTKRGSSEKPVVSYDGQFSLSQVAKKIDMLMSGLNCMWRQEMVLT